ncbi:energy-coupling factor ABC transporter ATP-binding protein [Ligilactobacillus faecis]|uniref:ABC transporter ATP-binding protein n=1 Tax=Ligilactobacillus faecis TaxID=762833 RepID=A0ABV4DPL5_9LACO|nr:ABC transporter ATP-binding protein [Ligilactobacillus faecis]WGN90033.1 ABC transporter ATP-binding protein [Ligilactobacillus faecis]
MIKLSNAVFDYDGHVALDKVSLDVFPNETLVIMGPNGSGKSTLLKILTGFFPLHAGEYYFNDLKIDEAFLKDPSQAAKLYEKVGFVFQDSDVQLFNMSVAEELAFGPRQLGLSPAEVDQRVNDCLKLLSIEHLAERVPYHLSGGEKKLVAIGSVLTMNPEVFVLDEPFNGLSPHYRTLIVELLDKLHQSGKTIIMSSHHFGQIKDICDRVILFSEKHRIERIMPKDQILADPVELKHLSVL